MNAQAPRILVPTRVISDIACPDTGKIYGVWDSYINKLAQYNSIPILVPLNISEDSILNLIDIADGLMLTGGEDINPEQYGQKTHNNTKRISDERDRIELFLAKEFLRRKKPVLGICRGCQILSVADNGTLYQEITELNINETHSSEGRGSNMSRHDVIIDQNSKLFKILGKTYINVNTAHHQAVKTVGSSFNIAASSPAGIIEAIEHQDLNYFCIGIQSHPEAENADLEPIFTSFVQACKKT
jgi:putative glutamine amidotransferase